MQSDRFTEIKRFNSDSAYKTGTDMRSSGKASFVKLQNEGMDLIAEYYADKYNMAHLTRYDMASDVAEQIKSSSFTEKYRKSKEDVRVPFSFDSMVSIRSLGNITLTHSSPVIYVKEHVKDESIEGILYFDSAGDSKSAKILAEQTGLQVYTVPQLRQMDYYSCHLDMLLTSRELAGKDKNGKYFVPNVLQVMASSVTEPGNPAIVKLPTPLLSHAQHPRASENRTHEILRARSKGPETVQQFYDRFPEDVVYEKGQPTSGYLRQKGIKMANIMEIQFYIKQLSSTLGPLFNDEERKQFISQAKQELKKQDTFDVASIKQRKGLYDFTLQFEQKILRQNSIAPRQKETKEKSSFSSYTKHENLSNGDYYQSLLEKYRNEDQKKTVGTNISSYQAETTTTPSPTSKSSQQSQYSESKSQPMLFPDLDRRAQNFGAQVVQSSEFGKMMTQLEETLRKGRAKPQYINILSEINIQKDKVKNEFSKLFKKVNGKVDQITLEQGTNIQLNALNDIGRKIAQIDQKLFIQFISEVSKLSAQKKYTI